MEIRSCFAQVMLVSLFRNSCWTKQHRSIQIEVVIISFVFTVWLRDVRLRVRSFLRSFKLKLENINIPRPVFVLIHLSRDG